VLLVALGCAASGLAPFTPRSKAQGTAAARTLSFDERVAYQRAVDEVYWRHTVWPEEGPAPKPSFDAVVTREQTAAKVEDVLRKSEALARRWGRPVSPEQLQAEAARMARETRSPAVLREIFDALGRDPFLIAEVLARPALVERLARTSFASDVQASDSKATFDSWWAGAGADFNAEAAPSSEFSYRLAEINQAGADDTWRPTASLPVGNGTAVWTGAEVIVWGGATSFGGRTNLGSRYNPATDTWATTSTTDGPLPRAGHTAVWTGTEMIVFGGSFGTVTSGHGSVNNTTSTGGRYNPLTDTWTPTSTAGAPFRSGHLAVWTGSKMIVWGDSAGSAHLYDPSTDSWKAASAVNAPGTNVGRRAVWTGAEMFIWGGLNTTTGKRGGLYNPSTDTWRTPSHFNAPSDRNGFTMVWTGSEAIVWGGFEGNTVTLNTGARYNPSTDTWTPTSTANAADSRYGHTAVWTGAEMVVYGGDSRPTGGTDKLVNTGGRYNPSTDSWTLTSTAGAPLKNNHVAVWTGSEMFVWGGRHVSLTVFTEAARYKPSTDSWILTNNANPPSPSDVVGAWSGAELLVWGRDPGCSSVCKGVGGRYDAATNQWKSMSVANAPPGDAAAGAKPVWTGSEMIVAGARYSPLTDSWAKISTDGAPPAVAGSAAVWTGTELLVWGSVTNNDATMTAVGGRYDPKSDTWKPMSMAGAPDARNSHSAVWTGTEMVVWGGTQFFAGSTLNTGGRYDPSTDTWRPTSTAGAPEARLYNTAVWTGTEMVVWGGWVYNADGTSHYLNTGGRYNPVSDTWQPTSTAGAPGARSHHRAVWTGSMMVVWGGRVPVTWTSTGDPVNTGARYNPSTDLWTPTSTQSAPAARDSHVQVWTGAEMIVFGGTAPGGAPKNDGAVYSAPGGSAVNTPPSVSLTAPSNGAGFQSGDTVRLSAEASDADGSVTAVRFYANDRLVGTATQSPFVFDWTGARGGDYAVLATAVDDAGGESRTPAVNISVAVSTAPPVCTLDAPADNSSYAYGASVRMDATAAANRDRAVTKVEFLDNDSVVSAYSTPTYGAPWSFLYLAPASGPHALAARCTDSSGASTTSAVRVVTVADRGYSVGGQILDERGFVVPNVRVRLDGPAGAAPRYSTTTVANNGNYSFTGLDAGGTYTVTPEPGSWRFSPESVTYASLSADKTSQNFTATQAGYGISGYIKDAGGNPVFPATVNLSGSKTATTGVDVTGYYFFSNLAPGGTYTVQPNKNLYAFEPNFRTFANLSAEQTADFVGTPQTTVYTVAGRVVDSSGAPVAGLRMRLDTVKVTSSKYRTTDAQGRFSFDNVAAGENCGVWAEDFTYTYFFAPAKRDYIGLAGDVADADFVATPRAVTGRVTREGAGLAGVTVTLNGPQTATVTTGDDGAFAIRGITLRGDYTITAAKQGYALSPAQYAVADLKDDVTANFAGASLATPTPTPAETPTPTATPTPTPTPVPVNIDDSSDFVAQHYRDFLGREADASGLSFWTNEMEKCGADQPCRDVRRINVSAAFFLSIEFQETGYLVYRLQKATDGRAPLYADFVRQSREIGDRIVIGRDGWEAALEANKRAFVERWTQTPEFRAAHDVMSNEEYVDSLFHNAGLGFGDALRVELVAGLASGAETRATALRRVAEHDTVRRAHFNRAFVTMQYFGYMRRDPDDVGFNFWLSKLDSFGGNFVAAEMVKAFLSSDEYRVRFAR
jgi:N-acetylneuraminic acid mutarotase